MKKQKITMCVALLLTALLLMSCTSEELTIQIDPKTNANGHDSFSFIDGSGKKIPDFGGLFRSIAGLKINGKDVFSVTVVDMPGAQGKKGLYFALDPEQVPKTKRIELPNGNTAMQTSYSGGTMLAAGPMFKFKYKKSGKSLDIITQ